MHSTGNDRLHISFSVELDATKSVLDNCALCNIFLL